MEILGIGPSELIFVIIIAIIILGPKDMQKAGRTLGKWMRDIVTSDGWKIFQQTSRELRGLPNRLMREANEEINQLNNELNNVSNRTSNLPTNPNQPPRSKSMDSAPAPFPENTIAPPKVEPKEEEDHHDSNA